MQLNKIIAITALLGFTNAIRLQDDSDPNGKNFEAAQTYEDMTLSGHNGADEDEIMDNIYGRFSKEGRTPSGHKTG